MEVNSDTSQISYSINDNLSGMMVKNPKSDAKYLVNSLWEGKPAVLILLRRFGCLLCRAHCIRMSRIKSTLDQNGIRLIAIGFDSRGYSAFSRGNYFTGEVFIDEDQVIYKALQLERVSSLKMMYDVFISTEGRKVVKDANELGIDGSDLEGDGLQLGGTYIVNAGGEVLFGEKQTSVISHVGPDKILEVLTSHGLILKDKHPNSSSAVSNNTNGSSSSTSSPGTSTHSFDNSAKPNDTIVTASPSGSGIEEELGIPINNSLDLLSKIEDAQVSSIVAASSDRINVEDLILDSNSMNLKFDNFAIDDDDDDDLTLELLGISGDCCEIPPNELEELMELCNK
jgi:prostamide/prostaglandin F2alpha synthase